MADSSVITSTVSLTDRFGDNGLISVAVAKVQGDVLEIDTWLMSCRVLRRGVESCVLNHLCSAAKQRGLSRVRRAYLPTPKNDLVREHYATLQFTRTASGDDGRTVWELPLETWQPLTHFIQLAATAAQ